MTQTDALSAPACETKPLLRVVLCAPRGFCAGVVRAIEIVERALKLHGPPVYVRHEIVHNKHVVESLKAKGVIKGSADHLRVLGAGDVAKKLTIRAHHFSASAKEKIEKAGGKADVIPPPKKPVRNKMKPRPARNSA